VFKTLDFITLMCYTIKKQPNQIVLYTILSEKSTFALKFIRDIIKMNNICLLFPGQGSQKPGMGRDLQVPDSIKNEVWDAAREVYTDLTARDLQTLSEVGTAEEIAPTEIAQPLVAAVSLIYAKALIAEAENNSERSIAAGIGHSLGEYALFAAAGMITTREMFMLIKARAAAMNECCIENPGAMIAVMGADTEELLALCKGISKDNETFVAPVNYNSDVQTVVAGDEAAVNLAAELLTDKGLRTVKLAVAGAFHTPRMKPAAEVLRKAAASMNIEVQKPAFDVYSNVTGKLLDTADLPDYLAMHMISPVRFTDEVRSVRSNYPDITFAEYGKTLSAMIRKIS
jgi:[acyl-carrier-protein] S-malonyltransferase